MSKVEDIEQEQHSTRKTLLYIHKLNILYHNML